METDPELTYLRRLYTNTPPATKKSTLHTTTATTAKKDLTTTAQTSHSTLANFFQEVKNLVQQLKLSTTTDAHKKLNPVQEQLTDFGELLTAF